MQECQVIVICDGFLIKIFILKNFLENFKKNFPVANNISLCGIIVEADKNTGLAKKIENFIYGGKLRNSY